MRRRDPRRGWATRPLVAIIAISLIGAGPAKKKRSQAPPPKVEETVSDLAYIVSAGETKLEGVGLVVGLDNTGADPPPSYYRTKLLDEMRKAGVEDANRVLADKTTSLVIVRVKDPDGDLHQGPHRRRARAAAGQRDDQPGGGLPDADPAPRDDDRGGRAQGGPGARHGTGAVMIGTDAKPTPSRTAACSAAPAARKDIPFSLVLKDSRKSIKTAAMLQKVGQRAVPPERGIDQKEMATAKTDQFLVLKVPRVYHNNQGRYFQVVKLLPMVDTPDLRAQRTERWGKELLDPKTAGVAALRLEGLGLTRSRRSRRAWPAPTRRSASGRPRRWPTSTTPRASTCWARPPPDARSSAPSPWRRWRRWTSRPRT
jgi:hypothetical protein